MEMGKFLDDQLSKCWVATGIYRCIAQFPEELDVTEKLKWGWRMQADAALPLSIFLTKGFQLQYSGEWA